MKREITIIIILIITPFSLIAQNGIDNTPKKVNPLIGNWNIDLRPTPDAEG